ncbi:MAG: hypothetical protein HYT77_02085 [Deltaproteobacteria bacterium]|nr:hypothetical protein [Deltaproteobacteria bacterium]
MRSLSRISLLLLLLLTSPLSAQMNSGPLNQSGGPSSGPNQINSNNFNGLGGVDWSTVAQISQEEGRYVRQVFLDLRTMNASEAASEGDFYLGFPTLDRRHQYRYLTRGQDQGLRLRFHSVGGQSRQTFDWRLQGPPGSDSCVLTRCDLPSIPIEDMEPVEIHTERPGCGATDAIGVEEATISYVLNNGSIRRTTLNNLWIPCVEFPSSASGGERIKKLKVILNNGSTERSSLGQRIKGKIELGNGVFIPLATQTSSGTLLGSLTYEFLESYQAYRDWLAARPDSSFWVRAELGCRANYQWSSRGVERCAEDIPRFRPNREGLPSLWFEIYCENSYDSTCRYYPPPRSDSIEVEDLKIQVSIDYSGWYGWNNNEEIDPVYIDEVEMQFEKENGERFTLSYNAGYQLPCSNVSHCTIEAEPERVYQGGEIQLSWRISGRPTSVNDTIRYANCFTGVNNPLNLDVDLPMQGEAECPVVSGFPFWIDTRWSCPDIAANSRRVGVFYRNTDYTYRCEAPIEYRGPVEIVDSAGCPYTLHGYDEQYGTSLSTVTMNNYISKFGIGLDRWRNLTPDYLFYQNRNPFKRLLTAIHFLKNRRWENYNQELFEGERIRDDSFYELAGRPIDSLRPMSSCESIWAGWTSTGWGDEDVTLSKRLIFESHPFVRAEVIVHEGWHAYRDGASHYDCNGGDDNCDYSWDSNGAYRAGVIFDSWIYGECANCSPLIREMAQDQGNVSLDWQFYIDPGFRL